MATPMEADKLLKALRDEGLKVVERPGWRTHNRNHKGPFGPINGVMIHHTVTHGTERTVDLCYSGYSGLPGPLCHGVIAKDGTVYLVGNGRANHAGMGDDDVLDAVVDERDLPADNEANTDGNRHFYGFECENLGDGRDPWPAAQLEAIERAAAAICRFYGWKAASVIGHLEWQPGKVDPRGFTMDSMRKRISGRLGSKPAPAPAPSKPSGGTYTVRDDDTLWGIAREADMTVDELKRLNGLKSDLIHPGDKLKLSATKAPSKPSAPKYEPYPGTAFFMNGRQPALGKNSAIFTAMGKRLVAEGCGRYRVGPGPKLGQADINSYEAWQRKLGYSGSDAKWPPGPTTWNKLKVPNS